MEKRRFSLFLCFSFAVISLTAGCSSKSGEETTSTGYTIRSEALLKAGETQDGYWILPNGRMISPIGSIVSIDRMPLGLSLSPDGSILFATSNGRGRQSVSAIDTESGVVLSSVEEDALFLGLAVSPDGTKVYASGGGTNEVEVFEWNGSVLTNTESYPVAGYPAGLDLSADGSLLYVVSQFSEDLSILDTSTGEIRASVGTGAKPFTVVLSKDGSKAFVSAESDSNVIVYDVNNPSDPHQIDSIAVQKNPEWMDLTSDGSRLYVANADEDSVSVIDTNKHKVVSTIDLKPLNAQGYGSGPNWLSFSPDGKRLFVAQAADNKVSVIELATQKVIGAIPAAWYPTAVTVSSDGGRIFIANAKGKGSGPNDRPQASLSNDSSIQIVNMPSDSELASMATTIEAYNSRSKNLFDIDADNFNNPVPPERGGKTPFKHVIIVVRENKTYDALLGNYTNGDGVPENCLYCDEETPNLHALAERFASGDNYYSNAEVSIQGHELLTSSISNTYVEKNWHQRKRPISFDLEIMFNPATFPKKQFIFQNAIANGIDLMVYGESVGLGPDLLILNQDYVHWGPKDPPVFWIVTKDVDKLDERIAEWESSGLPEFVFMAFPNDHTMGCEFPFPTPRSMIADNDLATGRFVEWLSHSKYWKDSVVFVIEDDPQDGVDHIDAHRSIFLAISPYARRGYVSGVFYHEGNLHATVEHILNLPPLSVYDENAQPAWDLFSNTLDMEPFTALPREVPEEISMPGTTCAEASMGLNFLEPDEAEGLQDILWKHAQEPLKPEAREWAEGWQEVFDKILDLKNLAEGEK